MKNLSKLLIILLLCFLTSSFTLSDSQSIDSYKIEKAIVYVYRPNNFVGFVSVFNLKVNGEKMAKIKNGKNLVLELEPSVTEFKIRNKTLELNLEAGKTYYLRTVIVRNMFLGKPDLTEVTESFAESELGTE